MAASAWPACRSTASSEACTCRSNSGATFSDETHAILAALGGQGVALLSLTLVAEELRSGALVQPCGPVIEGDGYYLVYPAHRRDDDAVRAVRAWIGPGADSAMR